MRGLLPKIVMASLVLMSSSYGIASDASDVSAINALQKQIDSAIINGDTDRYLTLVTDDAVLMPPNAQAVVGRDAIRKLSKAMSESFRIEKYVPSNEEIVIAGDWAFRRASFAWSIRSIRTGDLTEATGKFIIVYSRQPGGSWKLARDIWNSNED